ncbi:hypothetical protein Tco_1256311 [Tanacetum coccineum]
MLEGVLVQAQPSQWWALGMVVIYMGDQVMSILVESNDEGVTVVSELVIPTVNPDVYGNLVPPPLVSMDGAPGCEAGGSGIAVVSKKSDHLFTSHIPLNVISLMTMYPISDDD